MFAIRSKINGFFVQAITLYAHEGLSVDQKIIFSMEKPFLCFFDKSEAECVISCIAFLWDECIVDDFEVEEVNYE